MRQRNAPGSQRTPAVHLTIIVSERLLDVFILPHLHCCHRAARAAKRQQVSGNSAGASPPVPDERWALPKTKPACAGFVWLFTFALLPALSYKLVWLNKYSNCSSVGAQEGLEPHDVTR